MTWRTVVSLGCLVVIWAGLWHLLALRKRRAPWSRLDSAVWYGTLAAVIVLELLG